jgi:hypothetical protein
MKISIRMVTIATCLLWAILIVVSATLVYSMKDFRIDFGNLQTSVTNDSNTKLEFPLGIVNSGYFSMQDFNISTEIQDQRQNLLARGSTLVDSIPAGSTANTTLQISADIKDILQNHQDLIFNDSTLQITTDISVKTAELITFKVSSNSTMPWGAPLFNLVFSSPENAAQAASNSTDPLLLILPMSFENHAFFNINGTIVANAYNSTNILVGTGNASFSVPQQSKYKGELQFEISKDFTQTGHFEILFSTSIFDYGPVVIAYG